MRPRDRQRFEPDAGEFGEFAAAVAKRYSGRYPDRRSSHKGARLPAVRLYTTWNEPNDNLFLRPQWKRSGGELAAGVAPHLPGDARGGICRDQGGRRS